MTWAQRLKRVFKSDIETCETCGGTMKVIASIEDPTVIKNPRCKQRGIKFVRPLRIAKELFAASCGEFNPQ